MNFACFWDCLCWSFKKWYTNVSNYIIAVFIKWKLFLQVFDPWSFKNSFKLNIRIVLNCAFPPQGSSVLQLSGFCASEPVAWWHQQMADLPVSAGVTVGKNRLSLKWLNNSLGETDISTKLIFNCTGTVTTLHQDYSWS